MYETHPSRGHVLVVRLDSLGDMVLCGPAIHAVEAGARRVTVLTGPRGAEDARMLPFIDDVIVWDGPSAVTDPPPVQTPEWEQLVRQLADAGIDEALILAASAQQALPVALLLRLAGIRRISGVSNELPGTLLDTRIAEPADGPETLRMLAVAEAAGFELPTGEDGTLRIEPNSVQLDPPPGPYIVLCPGSAHSAEQPTAAQWRAAVARFTAKGWQLVVTGDAHQAELTASLAAAAQLPGSAIDFGGRLSAEEYAALVRRASAVLVAHPDPNEATAACDVPLISWHAAVPEVQWAPFGVPAVLSGEQDAPCRGLPHSACPVPGRPCLRSVSTADIEAVVDRLVPISHTSR